MADLDISLNTSKKSLLCNHCMFDCTDYENMREHYKSEFHKYNLNRVTMNLNPLTFEEYQKKKEIYQKLHESKLKAIQSSKGQSEPGVSLSCDICVKKFSSQNKFKEHMSSRAHKRSVEYAQTNPAKTTVIKSAENEKTTLEDVTICLFCNLPSENIEKNVFHMINVHKFEVPLIFCVKNVKGLLRLLAKKIVTYLACITCDSQNFKNYRSLQNHMVDKGHTQINNEDLEEFLYKFYDKRTLLSIKDKNLRRSKEFRILKIKTKIKRPTKKEKTQEEEAWETVSEEESDSRNNENPVTQLKSKVIKHKDVKKEVDDYLSEEEDYEPITLPNGELLLENGTILGNKIYQVYYKQRIHLSKFHNVADESRIQRLKNLRNKNIQRKNALQRKEKTIKFQTLSGSNKASFYRVNTLFHVEMYC